jgi:hypothetical protein
MAHIAATAQPARVEFPRGNAAHGQGVENGSFLKLTSLRGRIAVGHRRDAGNPGYTEDNPAP